MSLPVIECGSLQLTRQFSISTYRIPTWTTPLVILLFTTALIPGTSLLGHLCSVGVGYICMLLSITLSYSRLEIGLTSNLRRWFGLPENPCAAGESPSLDRRKAQPSRTAPTLCLN